MSSAQPTHEYEGVNALSLDGGATASLLSSVELVEELMRRLQKELGLPDLPLPRKHFRLMVGAGFAGLGMSVQEAKRHCVAIMDAAFSEKKTFGHGVFKRTKLKAAVERMLESCGVSASEPMLDPEAHSSETCKVMVCVSPESGMRAGSPTCLRTYTANASGLPDCTIVEAICSSFAVSGLFKPTDVAELGGIKSTYVGLSSFNPTLQLLDEAVHLFQDKRLACVVSIAAAQKQTFSTECERVAQEMLVRFMNRPGHYFRLSVDQGMEDIMAIDWERRSEGTAHARTYLSVSENDTMMAGITRAVLEKNKGVPTMYLRGSIPEASSITHTTKLCPPPSPLFVQRDGLLSRIERCLGDTQGQRVCVLHGLGGVGKTQLAWKYVEMHANDYDHIFYADCTSKHTIDADLKRIALARNVGDCANDALTWLARLQERWLIVYDNADDTSINLRGYFPSCSHGSILITTRNYGMTKLARGVGGNCHVSNMSEDEARGLLAKATGMAQGIGAPGAVLVEVLSRFPLAIVQAGAYVQANMCTIEDYIEMYQTSRGQILDDYASEVQKADNYELSVYATWQVSYRKLSPLAKQLYNYLAFMHHDQIVEDIFRFAVLGLEYKHALPPTDEETRIERMATEFLANFTRLVDGTWDKAVFLRAIKNLTSYSLLTYDENNRSYSIHPLVQQWTRTVVSDPGSACSCVAFLIASSTIPEYKTEDYAHRRVLLNHADCLPDSEKLKPPLAWRFCLIYRESGRVRDEERLVKAEYNANLRTLGQDSPYTLRATGNLALTYWSQGRWGEAEVLQREVVEVGKQVWGYEHPNALIAMTNLALTYWTQGRWEEAEALQHEVLEVGRRVWGNENPPTLVAMGNLAVTYWSQGRWGEAEVLQREVIGVRRRASGNEYPVTVIAMGNLGATYLDQGRWGEAEVLQREVVGARRQVSGDEHPETMIGTANLAQTYKGQGRWGEAEVLQREVVEVRERVLGKEHPSTLIAMGNLAVTYSDQGRWGEAEVLQQEVVEVGRRVWGNEHPSTLIAMGNLATTYSDQGRWGEAEVLRQEVVEVGRRILGGQHPNTLIAMGNLAVTYSDQGRWGEAEALRREVVEIGKRVWGNEHPDTLTAMENLAATCLSQGWWREAEVLRREVLQVKKRVSGDEHPNTLVAMTNLASTYWAQERWGEAEVLQHKVVEIGRRVWGNKHPSTLIAVGNLAATYSNQGRRGEAEPLLREVVDGGKRVWGNEHPNTLCFTRRLDEILSYLAQLGTQAATLPIEADPSTQLLEASHLDTPRAAEMLDNVQSKPKEATPAAVHNQQLIFLSLAVALVFCFFSVYSVWSVASDSV
ncbi:hypothetical protein FRC09_002554 [Ceratobasidium sp. 395]|nr:hypothetical protein FRC09_002554 [Ceratobasidium sp. 395]